MVVLPDHVWACRRLTSYQELFRYNVRKLIETAKAAGVEAKAVASDAH